MNLLNYNNPDNILARIGFVPRMVEIPIEYQKLIKEIPKRKHGDPCGERGQKGIV